MLPSLRLLAGLAACAAVAGFSFDPKAPDEGFTYLFDPVWPRHYDRMLIADLLAKYARAIDHQDMELYRSCFIPGAIIDYTDSWAPRLPVEEMVEFLPTLQGMRMWTASHIISNIEIDFVHPSLDKAKVRALVYYTVTNRGLSFAVRPFFTAFSVYHHDMVKMPDGSWKSAGLYEDVIYDTLLVTIVVGLSLTYHLVRRIAL